MRSPRPGSSSFTLAAPGLLNVLITECGICLGCAADTPAADHPPFETFRALWDTGASASVITQAVVDRCGLKPTGMVRVHDARGETTAETYLVNFALLNNVQIAEVRVSKGVLAPHFQALIGMDIITLGDFSVTNQGGRTVFSFRVPSMHTLDYVKEHGRVHTPWGSRRAIAPQSKKGKKRR